jgi:hypothetical protein
VRDYLAAIRGVETACDRSEEVETLHGILDGCIFRKVFNSVA